MNVQTPRGDPVTVQALAAILTRRKAPQWGVPDGRVAQLTKPSAPVGPQAPYQPSRGVLREPWVP